MDKQNITVLRKILYAVESGNQIYGEQDYAAFAEVGANCSNEKAITIGAGQWYADEAKELLYRIQRGNPKLFKDMDTENLEADLLKKSWATYAVSKDSAKGRLIISIISMELGKKCQDQYMEDQIAAYAKSIEKTYGTMPDSAMMECINIHHQGGESALKRILAKTVKPYTADKIYTVLCLDPTDPVQNQVGDYIDRQKAVISMIRKYAVTGENQKGETTMGVKISNCGHDENGRYAGGQAGDQTGTEYQIINWYNRPWLCVLRFEDQEVAALIAEMATQAANNNMIGYDQGTAGNSNDRYTFWEQLAANGYDPSKIKKPCETDCSQSTASIVKAVGYRLNKPKLKAVSIYLTTYNMRSAFKTAGAKVLTDQKYLTSGTCLKPGDILLNDNHHVAIAVSGDASSNATPAKKNYLEKGDTGSEVTTMQKRLIKVGYSCGAAGADGDFGSDTDSALRKFQKDNGLTVDGQYGTNSKAKLTALYNKKVGTTTSNKKDVTTVAKEVIAGKWGSGDERKKKLTAAGYNYDTVQKKVNELLKASAKKSVAEIAKEVVSGKWGNGADRKKKLEAAGYNYAEVQKEVNKLLK